MSQGVRISLAEAEAQAIALRDCFVGCFERWEFTGSLRRRKTTVGDIEHLIIPIFEDQAVGLFGQTQPLNLVWQRLEQLIAVADPGEVLKCVEPGKVCWGEIERRIVFRNFKHELHMATIDSWGMHLVIDTGPAEYGHRLVQQIRRYGYKCAGGMVRTLIDDAPVKTRDEKSFLKLCGEPWIEPRERIA